MKPFIGKIGDLDAVGSYVFEEYERNLDTPAFVHSIHGVAYLRCPPWPGGFGGIATLRTDDGLEINIGVTECVSVGTGAQIRFRSVGSSSSLREEHDQIRSST